MFKSVIYLLLLFPIFLMGQDNSEVIYSKKEIRNQLFIADSIFPTNETKAYSIVEKALNQAILNADKREEALCYLKLGEFNSSKKNYVEAVNNFDQAINSLELFGSQDDLIKAYKLSASTLEKTKEIDKSISRYISLKNLLIDKGDMLNAITYKIKVGYLFLQQGNIEDAKVYFDYSYLYAEEESNKKQMIESLIGLGKVEEYLGSKFEAKSSYKKALFLSKELNNKELIQEAKELLSRLIKEPEVIKNNPEDNFYKKSLENIEEKVQQLEKERKQKKVEIDLLKKEQNLNVKEIEVLKKEKALDLAKVNQQKQRTVYLSIVILLIGVLLFFLFKSVYQKQKAYKVLELKSLRTQMNPHFIFNSLNSVNNYISQNDERSANRFLSNFSMLMREVMDSSQKEFISLSDEVKMLSNYISLEHSRFKDKFDYEVNIDKSILLDEFVVPPMLIQPYIENAIWHGLRYKKEKGMLLISFKQTANNIIIEIEDNGIGRIASEVAKTKNQKQHISTGMKNINSRIELINSLYKAKISAKIIDLDQPKSGTKVILSLGKNLTSNLNLID